jgi:hypothetical protein
MAYKLSKKLRLGLEKLDDGTKTPWTTIRDNGDFRRTIDFTVSGRGPKAGAIFQYIQKKTDAVGVNEAGAEVLLNTSEAISKFTDNNVNHMCKSYLEYFEVDNDGTTWGDQFGNGAISRYDEEGAYLDRELNISKGSIVQTGTSVFLPASAAAEFMALDWDTDTSLPANGLPYLPFDESLWNRILAARQSNVLTQKITVVWGYKADAHGRCIECDPPLTRGGRKTRKYRQ